MHVVLLGDSIFDNASYVDEGHSVSDLLSASLNSTKISLLAIDGDVTSDVGRQFESMPADASHVFLSCGGNDALRSISILQRPAPSVGEAITVIRKVTEEFRLNYKRMLNAILRKSKR